jgi:transketolase
LRAVPNLLVLRPCDGAEAAEAWKVALREERRPAALVLSRQAVAELDRKTLASAEGLARGAYVLAEAEGGAPRAILIATGTEVHLALEARAALAQQGIGVRVVSMPSFELFEAQDADYRESVLPASLAARVSIEAGATFGWERWIGERGVALGLDRFGASAPGPVAQQQLGFTVERVTRAVHALLEHEALAR